MMIFVIAIIAMLILLAIGSAAQQRTKRSLDELDKALEAERRFNPIQE